MLVHDRIGSGPPLVLIHGIGSRRGAWDPVTDRLAQQREVIAIDLPGFGESSPLAAGTSCDVAAYVDAVQAFFDEAGLGRPHVAGNSMGGGIALELARRKAIASATALSPIGFWSAAEKLWMGALLHATHFLAGRAGALIDRGVGSAAGRALLVGHMYGRPAKLDPDAAREDVAQLAAAPGWSATLRPLGDYVFARGEELDPVPVTIGWGTRDRLLVPAQARRAQAALPHARHVPLGRCGHLPMSDDPEGVAELLLVASQG
jgi:pimeloyl-ACP methyl ester carboxylesterase